MERMRCHALLEAGHVELLAQRIGDHHRKGRVGAGVLEADQVVDPFILIDVVQLLAPAAARDRRLIVGVVASGNDRAACGGIVKGIAVIQRVHHG